LVYFDLFCFVIGSVVRGLYRFCIVGGGFYSQ